LQIIAFAVVEGECQVPSEKIDVMSATELRGNNFSLKPLSIDHSSNLERVIDDEQLLLHMLTDVPGFETMKSEIIRKLTLFERRAVLPFGIFNNNTSRPVGMTSYLNMDTENKRVEIGNTWIRGSLRGPLAYMECNFLLLENAFEEMGCVAVELRVNSVDERGRCAVEHTGGKLDAILRNYQRTSDGTLIDICVYSIIAPEWPEVRAHLQGFLAP
jgi:RimJ/RimL family protein N-acetyltransferase